MNDILSESGIRVDGRKCSEIRHVNCKLGVFDQADGSSYFEIGNTKVLAAVYGPHEISENNKNKSIYDRAVVNCQYSMATFSTSERKSRPRGDYRSLEINAYLSEIFETAIITQLYPHSQIDIYLEVLQSDGSTYSACVNAASLALIHAGIPIKDIVCSCSAGFFNGVPLVDLNHLEETVNAIPTICIALLPKSKQTISIESSGRINVSALESLTEAVTNGCFQMLTFMKSVISNHIKELNV